MAAPSPPTATEVVQGAASDLSAGLLDGFVSILPYVVPVLIAVTVWRYVASMLSSSYSPDVRDGCAWDYDDLCNCESPSCWRCAGDYYDD